MLKKTFLKALSVLRIFLLLFCATLFATFPLTSPNLIAEPAGKATSCEFTIGWLQTNTVSVSISSCSFGVGYTIRTHNGKVLAYNIALSDLVAGFPDLAKNIKNGFAGNDASLMVIE